MHARMSSTRFLVIAVLCLIAAPLPLAAAQDQPAVSVVTGGLANPRGLTFEVSGKLLVAEAGAGGETPGTLDIAPPVGPIAGGSSGSVARIDDGCPVALVTGLASARNGLGDTFGPAGIAALGDRTFVLIAGGGDGNGNQNQTSGIYEVVENGVVQIADLGQWLGSSSPEVASDRPIVAGGQWVSLAPTADGSALLALEQGTGQLVQVRLSGEVTRIADLSALQAAPSSLAVGLDGTIYVGLMTREPFAAATAFVIRVGSDGTAETVWSGLTMVTGIAVAPDGRLYASQFSDSREEPPYLVPGTGSIVRQTGPESAEVLLEQVNFPGPMVFGPDSALYVSAPTIAADAGAGQILRIDPATALGIRSESLDLTPPSCIGSVDAVEIVVDDLGINPSTITIVAGTTVTWRIGGEFDHAVASDAASPLEFDSGVLPPGGTFSVTFSEPGTYPYFDGLNPERTGEIVVVSP